MHRPFVFLRSRYLAMAVVSLATLLMVLAWAELGQIVEALSSFRWSWFLLTCLVAVASRLLRVVTWQWLLQIKGVSISFRQALSISWIGHVFAFWTPAGIGSDLFRFSQLTDRRLHEAVLATLLLQRVAGLVTVCLLVLATLPFSLPYAMQESPQLSVVLIVVSGLIVLYLPLLFSRRVAKLAHRMLPIPEGRIAGHLTELGRQWLAFRAHGAVLPIVFLATLAETLSYVVINLLAAHTLGLAPSFGFLLCAMPLVYLVLRIPISLQAWGIQDGAMGMVMAVHGFDPAAGVAMSLVQRGVEIVCFLLPGVLLMVWQRRRLAAQVAPL